MTDGGFISRRMDLRIGIDARYADAPISGIGRYVLNLLRGIAEVSPPFRLAVLTCDAPRLAGELPPSSCLELVSLPRPPRSPGDQWDLPRLVNRLGLKLLHCPDSFLPLAAGCRKVVTVHDLIGITCRHLLRGSRKARWFRVWKAWLQLQCRLCDAVVTPSRYSAGDIARLLRVPPSRLHVIYNAIAPPLPAGDAAPAPVPAGTKCLLYVGRADPYKNLPGLVRALGLVRARSSQDVRLIVAGFPDDRYPQARQEARSLGLEEFIRFTGYLEEPQLAAWYRAASVFVFPSLYEGFGLPPLEAMSYGLPVASSDRTSMPEVLADAALFFNPEDPSAMAAAILRVLEDPILDRRLREAGPRRAAQFTLRQAGQAHLELYQRLLMTPMTCSLSSPAAG
jgi:glycosyltransferase involved in cell wall biosynthesis